MAETRRKFDQDFKEGAVRLVRETGKPIAQVARELGVNEGTLGNWVGADRRRREAGGGELSADERAELARLRKECAELRMRCDVLKRSLVLWVADSAWRTEDQIPCAVSCRALQVSRSWHYKWSGRGLPPRAARRERLKAEVRRLFERHEGKRGSPMLTADLRDAGWTVSENTVAALMRELGLAARPKKKRRATTRPGSGRQHARARRT